MSSTFANVISVEERGRLKANPNSAVDPQMVEIGKNACDGYGAPGRDVIKAIDGNLISISIDGVEYTFDSPVDYTDAAAVEAAIAEKLENSGTDAEYNIWVKAKYDSDAGTTVVTHDGQRTIDNVKKSGGTFTAARTTLVYAVAKYSLADQVGALGPVAYNGSEDALDNTPYAHSGTPGTDATTADTLATDLATSLANVGLTVVDDEVLYRGPGGVSVTVDDINSAYDIEFWIKMPEGPVEIGGTALVPVENKIEIIPA